MIFQGRKQKGGGGWDDLLVEHLWKMLGAGLADEDAGLEDV